MTEGHFEILAPGLLTTVQDTIGRTRFGHLGVRPGGAMDAPAAALANRLVGNPPDAALLEATFVGPTLRIGGSACVLAVTGADLSASLDEKAVAPGWGMLARAGSTLSFGERRAGVRAYIAFSGGIDVPRVLGSRSTDLLSAFGGVGGRALRGGDRLPLAFARPAGGGHASDVGGRHGSDVGGGHGSGVGSGHGSGAGGGHGSGVGGGHGSGVGGGHGSLIAGRYVVPAWQPPDPDAPVRILAGPHLDRFAPGALDALCARQWRISERADRMGYRLMGSSPLRHLAGADVASLGLPGGAIQVPADGQPIVLLADHQPTGGYAVLATVIQADLPILAQRGPGDFVNFVQTTMAIARTAPPIPAIQGDEGEFAAHFA